MIFATGDLARWVRVLFERETEHTPVAFTVHAEYIQESQVDGLPVVPYEGLSESHPPDRCSAFVASGYRGMNGLRADVCAEARERGYELPNVICPTASVYGTLGDNVCVSPGVAVMPHATVGAGTILCAGAIRLARCRRRRLLLPRRPGCGIRARQGRRPLLSRRRRNGQERGQRR